MDSGSHTIGGEGLPKAQIDFKSRKNGSRGVSYIIEEPGMYSVGIWFNEEHITGSPYKTKTSSSSTPQRPQC